ncbi:hypothetical protein P7C70_g8876, partial [Phenoliferia sp. Uapishka_3]
MLSPSNNVDFKAESLSSLGLTNSRWREGGIHKGGIGGDLEVPSIPRSRPLMFGGNNVTKFLQAYELEFSLRGHDGAGMAELLPLYVKTSYFRIIREMPGSAERDWELLKKSMKEAFFDEELYKYGLDDLRAFVRRQKQKGRPTTLSKISRLYFRFLEISSYLKRNHIIGTQEETRYFLKILSADLVDEIYERRDRREQVKKIKREQGGSKAEEFEDESEEEELTVKHIMRELRFIFIGQAKRGKTSQLRGRLDLDLSESDSESASEVNPEFDPLQSTDDDEDGTHRSRSSRSRDSDSKFRRHQKTQGEDKKESGLSDGVSEISDLLIGFRELQAGLLKLLSERSEQASQSALAAQKVFKPRRDSKKREERKKRVEEKEGSVSMSSSEGSNIFTYGSGCILLETQPPKGSQVRKISIPDTKSGEVVLPGLSMNEGGKIRTHRISDGRTSDGGWCFWCNGEDGRHRLARCEDLNKALRGQRVWRDQVGKIRWGKLYIPAQSHPRGMRGWVRDKEALEGGGIQTISNRKMMVMDWRERDTKSLHAFPEISVPHTSVFNAKIPELCEVPASAEGATLQGFEGKCVSTTPKIDVKLPEAWDSTINLGLPELPGDWLTGTSQTLKQISASNPVGNTGAENALRFEGGDSLNEDCSSSEMEKTTAMLCLEKMIDRGVQTEDWLPLSVDSKQAGTGSFESDLVNYKTKEESDKEAETSAGHVEETGTDKRWEEPRASSSDRPSELIDQGFCCQGDQSANEIWFDLMELTGGTNPQSDRDRTAVTPDCNVPGRSESLNTYQRQKFAEDTDSLTKLPELEPLSCQKELNDRTMASSSDKPCGVEAKFDVNSHPRCQAMKSTYEVQEKIARNQICEEGISGEHSESVVSDEPCGQSFSKQSKTRVRRCESLPAIRSISRFE